MEKYSVLMSLYSKEVPQHLKLAVESMVNQTVPPDQIVIVKDGPLTEPLEETLLELTSKNEALFTIISFPENHGLAYALNRGVLQCRNELIARMDTDDISFPDRCEKELRVFEKSPDLSIVGGMSLGFTGTPDSLLPTIRKKPLDNEGIKRFMRRRSPFGHPTVMYRKSDVLRCGNYDDIRSGVEDYDLFSRMINSGCIGRNIDEPVLYFRCAESGLSRSKSNKLWRQYIRLQYAIWRRGHCGFWDFLYIWTAMTAAQIMPKSLYALLQQKLFRSKRQ